MSAQQINRSRSESFDVANDRDLAEAKKEKEMPMKVETELKAKGGPYDVADVVASYLPGVMRDRKNMRALEVALDNFIAATKPISTSDNLDERQKYAKEVLDQLTNAKLALESLFTRASQSSRS